MPSSVSPVFQEFLQNLHVPDLRQHPLTYVLTHVDVPEHGLILELGVYMGDSIRKIASRFPTRKVYGFDSFQGLPESWNRPDGSYDAGTFAVSRLPEVPDNVTLVPGWFDETLRVFDASCPPDEPIALLHIDCDIYSSTKTAFDVLGHRLQPGSILVFDEAFNYPTFEQHEILALHEFLCATGKNIEWIGKNGPVDLHVTHDNGYWDQPAALRIV